jgi:hypothetical protein
MGDNAAAIFALTAVAQHRQHHASGVNARAVVAAHTEASCPRGIRCRASLGPLLLLDQSSDATGYDHC